MDCYVFFFFQAEDGIRDWSVTGVQTCALPICMLPVAIGVGEGGEFYRPMAVAIIGGTITSTFLTLLIIPSFYDSIENWRDAFMRFAGWLKRRIFGRGAPAA